MAMGDWAREETGDSGRFVVPGGGTSNDERRELGGENYKRVKTSHRKSPAEWN